MIQKRLRLLSLFFVVLLSFAIPAGAEQPKGQAKGPQEEMQQQRMDAALQQMGPAMSSMVEGMMGGMFAFLTKPETAEKLATFTKNYYDALVRKGFSKDEALQIVVNVGIPSAGK